MSGLYGTIRPANINPATDVEIFYKYKPNRSTTSEGFDKFQPLNASEILWKSEGNIDSVSIETTLPGIFDLRLPLNTFNSSGIYNIYIRPKEYILYLQDVSVLADYPDIRGVVINSQDIDITDLTGYRIEYFDTTKNPAERTDRAVIITSCNFCTLTYNGTQNVYSYTDSSSNLLFCTVTPCSYGDFAPNVASSIGTGNPDRDLVAVINTKFSPVMLELELVNHDAETITTMLEGDTAMDHDHGIMTYYNDNKEIYQQFDFYEQKNALGEPLYSVKQKRESINEEDEDYNKIFNK